MALTGSRYAGQAEWHEEWNKPSAGRNAAEIVELLGPGGGLDLGCGGGLYFAGQASAGRTVVGLDRSADQLRIARGRSRQVVQGDAAALPFRGLHLLGRCGSPPMSMTSRRCWPKPRGCWSRPG